MADKGWVIAYRKSWTHPAFNNLREAAIWNFLYQNAFWEDGNRNFNGYTFNLKRGQIVVSISFLANGFGMTEKAVRVVIQKIEKLGMITVLGASRGTIITICNYDKYQQNEKTEGDQGASKGRAKTPKMANQGQTEGEQTAEPSICNHSIIPENNKDWASTGATEGQTEGEHKGNNNKQGKQGKEDKQEIYISSFDFNPESTKPEKPKKQKPKTDEVQKPESVTDQVWRDWIKVRKTKKAPLTETAWIGIVNQARKAGLSIQSVLEICCQRGWAGFNADWIEKTQTTKGNTNGKRSSHDELRDFLDETRNGGFEHDAYLRLR